jgi:predicted RNase H-like HicB family nuclease
MLKPTYRVTTTRSGRWWQIAVRELAGVHSQARRLDMVESMAREAIALALRAPEDSFDIAMQTDVGSLGALQAPIEDALRAREAAEKAQGQAYGAVRRAVHEIRSAGYTARDAGMLLGLSNQRISQIEHEERASE